MNFYKSKETIEKIKSIIENKQRGLYLRFGDGDVNLANGSSDMLQITTGNLKFEMIETFSIKDEFVLKSLPLHCKEYGLDDGMFPGNHECSKDWADNLLDRVSHFWGGQFNEIYSPVALHHLSTVDIEYATNFLKFIKNNEPSFFIGNENVPFDIKEVLFGKQCIHIKTPNSNSYSKIDEIMNEIEEKYDDSKYNLIITSMGCSGRVVQKRLYKKYNNLFVFDFGSLLDALCGWNTRAWIELTNFNNINFIEKLKNE